LKSTAGMGSSELVRGPKQMLLTISADLSGGLKAWSL
jgi:hypothetical protein